MRRIILLVLVATVLFGCVSTRAADGQEPAPETSTTATATAMPSASATTTATALASPGASVDLGSDSVQDAINAVIPRGRPEYGNEVGVTFEDPLGAVEVFRKLDAGIPTSSLSASEKKRYVAIGIKPGSNCEFCCGAPSMTDANGRLQCGCTHNVALSGLSKWLVRNRPQMSDEQIFDELQRWKAIWYPRDSVIKYLQRHGNLNNPETQREIDSLPQMIGGC